MEGLRGQLEEAKKKLRYASTEYKMVRDALAQAHAENARLAGDIKAATDCFKAMRENRDKIELAMGTKAKEAQIVKEEATKLVIMLSAAQVELENENKRNK